MSEPYINYDKEPLEIWEDPSFSVYDPWQAQVLGTFPSREYAETFMNAVYARHSASSEPVVNKAEFYIDQAGEHRWRVTSGNGKIVAASTEGYINRADAEKNFFSIFRVAQ